MNSIFYVIICTIAYLYLIYCAIDELRTNVSSYLKHSNQLKLKLKAIT